MNGSSAALTAGSTSSVRTVVLTSEQSVKEDKATVSTGSDVQETLSQDAVLLSWPRRRNRENYSLASSVKR